MMLLLNLFLDVFYSGLLVPKQRLYGLLLPLRAALPPGFGSAGLRGAAGGHPSCGPDRNTLPQLQRPHRLQGRLPGNRNSMIYMKTLILTLVLMFRRPGPGAGAGLTAGRAAPALKGKPIASISPHSKRPTYWDPAAVLTGSILKVEVRLRRPGGRGLSLR